MVGDKLWDARDADRSAPRDRTVTGWPLPPVDLDRRIDGVTQLSDGMPWPPVGVVTRQQRLDTYDRLWRGDMTDFVVDPRAVGLGVNYFRRVVTVLSALMTISGPQEEYTAAASEFVTNTALYGRGYLVNVGGSLWSPPTSKCYEDVDGSLHVLEPVSSVDAADQVYDRVEGFTVRQGSATVWLREATGQVLGQLLSEVNAGAGAWVAVDNPPVRDRWGTSLVDDLIPIITGISLRLTGAAAVLAANEAPTLVIPAPDADIAEAVAGSAGQPKTVADLGRREAQAQLTAMRGYDYTWGPDGVDKGYVLEWKGNLENSWQMVDRLKAEMRMLTGIGAALEQEGGDVPSGAALRQMHFILWATTQQLHSLVVRGFESVGVRVVWPNPFEDEPEPQVDVEVVDDPDVEVETDA